MRKQTKLVAVLSAAALLAIGASMTSFAAAAHWDQQDGEWVYLDRNGDRVTDEWKKSNNQWYYLDADGFMAREQVIEDDDDKYYVDANGVRVTNAWVSMDNDDLLDDEDETDSIDTVWMYFGGTGKAVGCDTPNGEIKRLSYGDGQSGYFIFNEDGYMLSGWKKWKKDGSNTDLYYLGTQDQGWAHTGWQYLEVDPDLDAFSGIQEDDEEFNDQEYFYFNSNGKAVVDDTKSIGGKTYIFDQYGRMLDLWVYPSTGTSSYTNEKASSANATASYFREDNGGREKNWIFAYPNTGYDNYSDDPYWFYLDNNGRPFRADQTTINLNRLAAIGSSTRINDDDVTDSAAAKYNKAVAAKAIKSQTYLFNDKGVMLTGLYWLSNVHKGTSASPMTNGYYYFTIDGDHSSVEGQMVTNKRVTIDVQGDDKTYYFKNTGEAHRSAIINSYVYGRNGQLIDAYGDGSNYQVVEIKDIALTRQAYVNQLPADAQTAFNNKYPTSTIALTDRVLVNKSGNVEFSSPDNDPTTGNAVQVLINENGKIRKSGTVTDVNDQRVTVNNYKVTKIENRD